MLMPLMSYQVIHDFNLLSCKIHFQLEIFTDGFARKQVTALGGQEANFIYAVYKETWLHLTLVL